MRISTIIIIINIMGLLACASTNNTYSKKRYSRDLISSEEIMDIGSSNVFELIQRLRPNWLQGRGRKSNFASEEVSSLPIVYIDSSKHGDINSLYSLSTMNIIEIRFLNAGDATTRYGPDHAGGAILIKQL